MCLIALAYRTHPDYELLLAANRDEFHDRPTLPAAAWPDAPGVIGGRDGLQGGSWLALSAHRRLAAVTNVRRMEPLSPDAPSRGHLVSGFVAGTQSADAAAARLLPDASRYAGFNLLLWDGDALIYLSNRPTAQARRLPPGVYGLSNAALDTPWPKLLRLRRAVADTIDRREPVTALFAALADDTQAGDTELPDTGIGLRHERFLSPAFIRDAAYGTRASTLVEVPSGMGVMRLTERRFGPGGMPLGDSSLPLPPA